MRFVLSASPTATRADRGQLEPLPLDRSGAVERHVGAEAETVFGGYEVRSVDDSGVESRIKAFIVLASFGPLQDEGPPG